MIAQYIHNGTVIGTRHEWFNLPEHLKVPTRHTLQDLKAIPLADSKYDVRCVQDDYKVADVNLDALSSSGFRRYVELTGVKNPKFIHKMDWLRFHVKRVLVAAKVIN